MHPKVTAIKQLGTVGKDGKIELYTPELIEGTKVEVILLDSLIMQRQILYIVEFLDGEIQGQYHS